MIKHHTKIQDADAEDFYGIENTEFESQIEQIAGNDPRLLAAFRRTRDWFIEETDRKDKAGSRCKGSANAH